jgi:hypothetical protein
VNEKTGEFSGSFIDPKSLQFGTKKTIPFKGVIFQKQQIGVGYFEGQTLNGAGIQTGTVTINPAPPIVP